MAGYLDDHYYKALVAGPKFCVSCGREVEMTQDGYANHKCRAQRESARKAADSRYRDGVVQNHGFAERLADGFLMLEEYEDGR
jgi:hypothetical protein